MQKVVLTAVGTWATTIQCLDGERLPCLSGDGIHRSMPYEFANCGLPGELPCQYGDAVPDGTRGCLDSINGFFVDDGTIQKAAGFSFITDQPAVAPDYFGSDTCPSDSFTATVAEQMLYDWFLTLDPMTQAPEELSLRFHSCFGGSTFPHWLYHDYDAQVGLPTPVSMRKDYYEFFGCGYLGAVAPHIYQARTVIVVSYHESGPALVYADAGFRDPNFVGGVFSEMKAGGGNFGERLLGKTKLDFMGCRSAASTVACPGVEVGTTCSSSDPCPVSVTDEENCGKVYLMPGGKYVVASEVTQPDPSKWSPEYLFTPEIWSNLGLPSAVCDSLTYDEFPGLVEEPHNVIIKAFTDGFPRFCMPPVEFPVGCTDDVDLPCPVVASYTHISCGQCFRMMTSEGVERLFVKTADFGSPDVNVEGVHSNMEMYSPDISEDISGPIRMVPCPLQEEVVVYCQDRHIRKPCTPPVHVQADCTEDSPCPVAASVYSDWACGMCGVTGDGTKIVVTHTHEGAPNSLLRDWECAKGDEPIVATVNDMECPTGQLYWFGCTQDYSNLDACDGAPVLETHCGGEGETPCAISVKGGSGMASHCGECGVVKIGDGQRYVHMVYSHDESVSTHDGLWLADQYSCDTHASVELEFIPTTCGHSMRVMGGGAVKFGLFLPLLMFVL